MTGANRGLASKLLRGTVLVLLGDALGVGGSFLTRLVAARHLGPEGYGVVVIGLTFLNVLATVSLLGLPEGVARQIPRLEDSASTLRKPLLTALALAGIVSFLLWSGTRSVATLLGEPALVPVLAVFAAALPLVVCVRLFVGAFRGLEAVGLRVLVQNVLYQTGAVVAVAAGVALGAGPAGIAAAWLVAGAAAAAVGGYAVYRASDLLRGTSVADVPISGLLAFSLPLMISHGMWMLVEQADSIVLVYFSHAAAVGVYDASFTVGRMLLVLNGAASFLVLPAFSRLHADGDAAAMRRQYRTLTKAIVVVSVPVYCAMILAPDAILGLVYGERFLAGPLLAVVATGFFVHVLTGVNGNALIAVGRTRIVMRGNVYCLFVNLALNVALVPVLGPMGAAVASAISYTTATGYWGYHLYREVGIPPMYPGVVKGIALAVPAVFALAFALRAWIDSSVLASAVLVGAFVTLYPLVVATVFDRDEIDLLRPKELISPD